MSPYDMEMSGKLNTKIFKYRLFIHFIYVIHNIYHLDNIKFIRWPELASIQLAFSRLQSSKAVPLTATIRSPGIILLLHLFPKVWIKTPSSDFLRTISFSRNSFLFIDTQTILFVSVVAERSLLLFNVQLGKALGVRGSGGKWSWLLFYLGSNKLDFNFYGELQMSSSSFYSCSALFYKWCCIGVIYCVLLRSPCWHDVSARWP